jgi:hypothetical protein
MLYFLEEFAPREIWRGTHYYPSEDSRLGPAPTCPTCGRLVGPSKSLPPFRGNLRLEDNRFNDIVMASGGEFLFSEPLARAWQERELIGLDGFEEVTIESIKGRRPKSSVPPRYFLTVPQRGPGKLDRVASGVLYEPGEEICDTCNLGGIIHAVRRLVLLEGSWKGEDIFQPIGLGSAIVVSQRFKDLIEGSGFKAMPIRPLSAFHATPREWVPAHLQHLYHEGPIS